jgi:3-hydroxybutyrate dehydrogenase
VITGSTSGIGLGLAEAFAAAGCHVAMNGFAPPGAAEALAERIRSQHKVRVAYHPADLTIQSHCSALIEDTQRTLGSIDILVNNAGVQHVAPTEQFPADRWDQIIALNLSAAFHTIRAVLPAMQERKRGRIINIASVHGLVASMNKAAYVTAKHGLVGLTKVVALENAAKGITCNAICPGFVLTALVQRQIDDRASQNRISTDEAAQELLREKQPSGRFVAIEDIAAFAIFLCSEFSANINGATFPIDGGWTAQ